MILSAQSGACYLTAATLFSPLGESLNVIFMMKNTYDINEGSGRERSG